MPASLAFGDVREVLGFVLLTDPMSSLNLSRV